MNARRLARRTTLTINTAARGIAALGVAAVQVGSRLWDKRNMTDRFFAGLLGATGLTVAGLHQANHGQVDLALAFALVPVNTWAGQIAVIAVAVVCLIGFLAWNQRTMSTSFFRGVLAGTGFVLSFDIVLIHWIFGLHHITNTQMDVVLEPLFVLLGLAFLWFGIMRERRHAQ
jgi:hypothetical protein